MRVCVRVRVRVCGVCNVCLYSFMSLTVAIIQNMIHEPDVKEIKMYIQIIIRDISAPFKGSKSKKQNNKKTKNWAILSTPLFFRRI